MINDKLKDVLNHEGVVTVLSWGVSEPHLVNTWNSYIECPDDKTFLIPAYGFRKTEKNVLENPKVKISIGTKEVEGYNGYEGTGFIIEGTASFLESGETYDMMKAKYGFLTRVMVVTIDKATQKI